MRAIFTQKNGMIPENMQGITDRIGLSLTGISVYLNIRVGFLQDLILSSNFNSLLAIIISLLSILWITMKIYDQYLVTKERKEAKNGKA